MVEGLQVALDRRRPAQWPVGEPLPVFAVGPLETLEPPVPFGDVLELVVPDVVPLPAGVLVEVLPVGVEVLPPFEEATGVVLEEEPVDDGVPEPASPGWLLVLSGGSGLTPSAASAAADRAPASIAAAVASGRGTCR